MALPSKLMSWSMTSSYFIAKKTGLSIKIILSIVLKFSWFLVRNKYFLISTFIIIFITGILYYFHFFTYNDVVELTRNIYLSLKEYLSHTTSNLVDLNSSQ